MATFTTPTVYHTPPFTADTRGVRKRLQVHMQSQPYGVTVLKMSDGSYVQSEATPENSNTAWPAFPEMPDQGIGSHIVARSFFYTEAGGYQDEVFDIDPYVVLVYYGGRTYEIDSAEATALTAYTAYGIGYGALVG